MFKRFCIMISGCAELKGSVPALKFPSTEHPSDTCSS